MRNRTAMAVVTAAGVLLGGTAIWAGAGPDTGNGSDVGRQLKSVTINTGAYAVPAGRIDRRSDAVTADEDMHIVAIEHFVGVQGGAWSDNGHMLSLDEANPWQKWAKAGTGMEPTGTKGYFGYCGRDYYREVGGIGDIMAYETLPAGTHFFVPKGRKIHMHCYAHNFSGDQTKMFHHAVRLLYW